MYEEDHMCNTSTGRCRYYRRGFQNGHPPGLGVVKMATPFDECDLSPSGLPGQWLPDLL
jgi:hypothetical protein